MAITTQDGLISAIAAGRTVQFGKATATLVVSAFTTFFRLPGSVQSAAAAPAVAGATLSRTTQGALPIPAPSLISYFTSYEVVSSAAAIWNVADRLVETGALSGIVTTAQTVGSVALPARATGALDVELWLEVYTALGATPSATVTASYTNQAGTAGRTATLVGGLPASPAAGRTFQMALQAGDTGVQSVQSVTSATSSGTAGNFGVVLRRILMTGAVPGASSGFAQGYAETDLQICPDDACLELLFMGGSSASGTMLGAVGIAQG